MPPTANGIEESRRRLTVGGRDVDYVLRRSPRSRGLRVTIDPRRGVVVSVPPASRRGWRGAAAEQRIATFLEERGSWILRHLDTLERQRAAARERGGWQDGGRIHYRGVLHTIRVAADGVRAPRATVVERSGAEAGDELVIRPRRGERRAVVRILEAWLRDRAEEAIRRAVELHAPALRVTPASVVLRDPRTRWGSASKQGRLMFSWRLVLAPPDALETVVVHELAHLQVFGHGPRFWALVASRRPNHLADRAWLRRHSHDLHAALEAPPGAA